MSREKEGEFEPKSAAERRALEIALLLNVGLSASLGVAGIFADSSGLLASALDNTSDAAVYATSYYAVNRGPLWKTRAAQFSGVMLLVLSAAVLADVARRFVSDAEPASTVMMVMSAIAAVINVMCLRLLRNLRQGDVNLRAAWTFSINDLVANVGVLVAGLLVALLKRPWPDLVVGLAIALVAGKGGVEILIDARRTKRAADEPLPREEGRLGK